MTLKEKLATEVTEAAETELLFFPKKEFFIFLCGRSGFYNA